MSDTPPTSPARAPRPQPTAARAAVAVALAWAAAGATAQDAPDFARDVRPILAENCLRCHGPDEQRSGMRLDRADGGLDPREALRRVASTDPEVRMPPPESGKSLDDDEIRVLTRWLEDGAAYERHWSFVPPERPEPPPGTAEHPIDRFVDRRLADVGLARSPRADRATLARRVALDLVGLPPTPDRVAAFVADPEPDAYERYVDELLASPHYGERWARRWLDIARYADTNGYEKDRNRSIWPYRDWVVRALADDMPFDQFVVRQLAGDMLPDATLDDRVATGFHRNTMMNEEGGIDPLEFRYHALADRVATTGTAFLGLTLGCAQCHTHKYDPITHTEYFGLLAFFDQTDEPELRVPDEDVERARARNRARAEEELAQLAGHWPEDAPPLEDALRDWIATHEERTLEWTPLTVRAAQSNLPKLRIEDSDAGPSTVVFTDGDTTKHDVFEVELEPSPVPVRTLLLEALPDPRLPADGPGTTWYEGRKGNFFLTEIQLWSGDGTVLGLARAEHHAPAPEDLVVDGRSMFDGDLQTGWAPRGAVGRRHVAAFELGEALPAGTAVRIRMDFGRHYASSLGKFRFSASPDAARGVARALPREVEAILALPAPARTAAQRERLRSAFLMHTPRLREQADRIRDLRDSPPPTTTLVMAERPDDNRRTTRRRHRGEYLQPREAVEPHTPEVLHPWPDGRERDRLGLARWLTSADNPLLARVVVNRHWATLFGRGLVRTVDDFGARGAPPSHPELLDWLAVEFVERGWSLKRLHRTIVTSETYKQSSDVRPEHLVEDPENVWLARAPRFRLEAEILRDQALAVAGVLSPKMYGPPVRPPQPPGITEVAFGKPRWNAGRGEDRRRRSLYTFAKRTAPFALYTTFDAPSGETCVAMRERSDTPLQALALLNDPQMVEIAQAFGRRLAGSDARPADTIRAAFERVLLRDPDADELAALSAFWADQRAHYADRPEEAARAAGAADDGAEDDGAPPGDPADLAAWTALCRVLLGLDETVTRN